MTNEKRACMCAIQNDSEYLSSTTDSEDKRIMTKVRKIVAKGHHAEIRQSKDGTLTVMDVKKQII